MKITSLYPEAINYSKELSFFDSCLVEYFEGIEFYLFGSIEKISEEEEDRFNVNIMFAQDEEGKKISLSDNIKKEIEHEIETLHNLKKSQNEK
jgi:hypothetical protein